jgi:hypothetical protein
LNVEHIQHGALWNFPARTLRDRFSQQLLELDEIIDFGTDVLEVVSGDISNLTA